MGDLFHINPADPMPLYAQLERAIRFAIATGKLRAGDQLPTVRQLAVELRINANTVAKVYLELERAGVLETRRGVGTFVCAAESANAQRTTHRFTKKADRERELRTITDRFLAEALAHGFSPDEVIEHLTGRPDLATPQTERERKNHG